MGRVISPQTLFSFLMILAAAIWPAILALSLGMSPGSAPMVLMSIGISAGIAAVAARHRPGAISFSFAISYMLIMVSAYGVPEAKALAPWSHEYIITTSSLVILPALYATLKNDPDYVVPQVLIAFGAALAANPVLSPVGYGIAASATSFIRKPRAIVSFALAAATYFFPFIGLGQAFDLRTVPHLVIAEIPADSPSYFSAILGLYVLLIIGGSLLGAFSILVWSRVQNARNIKQALTLSAYLTVPPVALVGLGASIIYALTMVVPTLAIASAIGGGVFSMSAATIYIMMRLIDEGQRMAASLRRRLAALDEKFKKMRAFIEHVTTAPILSSKVIEEFSNRLNSLQRKIIFARKTLDQAEHDLEALAKVEGMLEDIEVELKRIEDSFREEYMKAVAMLQDIYNLIALFRGPMPDVAAELKEVAKAGPENFSEALASFNAIGEEMCRVMSELLSEFTDNLSEVIGYPIRIESIECGEGEQALKAVKEMSKRLREILKDHRKELVNAYNALIKLRNAFKELRPAAEEVSSTKTGSLILRFTDKLSEVSDIMPTLAAAVALLSEMGKEIKYFVAELIDAIRKDVMLLEKEIDARVKATVMSGDVTVPIGVNINAINDAISELSDIQTLGNYYEIIVTSADLLPKVARLFIYQLRYLQRIAEWSRIIPLAFDYITYRLTREGEVSIDDLPFRREVAEWLAKIYSHVNKEAKVIEEKIVLRGGE